MEKLEHKPHCLILPYPLQGHINPLLQFAKRLATKQIRITLAATKHLLQTTQDFSCGSSIHVESISDGFDEGWKDVDLREYLARFNEVGSETLAHLLDKLKNLGQPVDCVVFGSTMTWAQDVAKRFGLAAASYITQSCAMIHIYYQLYDGKIKLPFGENEEVVLPGLPVLRPSETPSFMYEYGSYPGALDMILKQFDSLGEADWIFVNTFYKLEQEVTDVIAKIWPVKPIGPCIPSMYLDKRLLDDKEYGLSLWKPATSACMEWLNKRESKSVIYVSFGSIVQLGEEQMEEVAKALNATGKYFLWVVRETEQSKLPRDFKEETREKGLVVSWCPQLEVLAHEAIGLFVTHCGWNSTLETLSLGVPMMAMPGWSDQSTNTKFVSDVWKIGIRARKDAKGIVRQAEMVRWILYAMDDEEGAEIREGATTKWKELAREAVDEEGTSDQNIQQFVSSLVARVSGAN